MNERIKELKHEAYEFANSICGDEFGGVDETRRRLKFEEKFAELIILEMCKELDRAQWDKGEDWICADGTRIIPQIKERFGVEE
jgi:hypothetical protein